jgi:hypothetical protein
MLGAMSFLGYMECWNSGILKKQLTKTPECIVTKKAPGF